MDSPHDLDLDFDETLDPDAEIYTVAAYEPEQITEVTEEDVERGVDVQGIEWSELPVTRAGSRDERLRQYKNYENLCVSHSEINKEIKPVASDAQFYKFKYTKLKEKCSFYHFQLRNLLWATSKNDIFYTFYPYVRQWSPHLRTSRTVLELNSNHPNSYPIKVSTMACHEDFLLVGGFNGAYVCQRLNSQYSPASYGIVTSDISAITNHIDITQSRSGATQAIISSNDDQSRIMDMESLKIISEYPFQWPVNCTTLSPDKRMLCVVGDSTDSVIANADTGEVVATLKGHIDYSFACCWSPDGRVVCTGNQDMTTRLYDTRNLSKAFCVLGAKLGAIRSLHFSSDGRYLAMAEPADFVHIFDAKTFDRSQVIDIFGEIAGVSFTPDAESLYVANADETYGSILEYDRSNRMDWINNLAI